MKHLFCIFVVACMVLIPAIASAEMDAPGTKDHPLFTRMKGYFLSGKESYVEIPFGEEEFNTDAKSQTKIQGKVFKLTYHFDKKAGKTFPSALQIQQNYLNAIQAIGGTVLFASDDDPYRDMFVSLKKDGKEFWAKVRAVNKGAIIKLTILEKEAMKQEVTAKAETMAIGIKDTGHIAVYGIYFDTGKTDIKPESSAAIAEIARLLQMEKALNVHVVGHTDSIGSLESNMKLSRGRAEAVMNTLINSHGITASRLEAHGVGPLAPVTSNATDEGKAKNRRVELVEQ